MTIYSGTLKIAAQLLQRACLPSPAIKAVAAVPAQPAHPAYPARPAVLAANNATGYFANELYKNSPAYPVGTPIPAIPPKAATSAVIEVVGIPAQAARPALPFYDGKMAISSIDNEDGTVRNFIDVMIPLKINPLDPLNFTWATIRPGEFNGESDLYVSVKNPPEDAWEDLTVTQLLLNGAAYMRIEGTLL